MDTDFTDFRRQWTEKLEASLPGEETRKTRRPTEQPGAPGEQDCLRSISHGLRLEAGQ